MGHLARQLAIAKAAKDRAKVTLFSLSAALPTATSEGVAGEYCPGPDRDWMPAPDWPQYLSRRLEALVEEVSADVVVFDGVAPYRGVTLAARRLRDTAFVWFRRGMWQQGVNDGQLWKSGLFDLIIEPGDLASEADPGPTARLDALRVSPVSLLEVIDLPNRRQAAEDLGLDASERNLLLTLGTGRLGDVSSPGAVILESILAESDWQVCIATSAVAQSSVPYVRDARVSELRGVFPLARYLNAFDAVVSAAGYNAVHEYLPAGLPTLLIPNRLTRTDDQVTRASFLAERGLALVVEGESEEQMSSQVTRLLDEPTRADLKAALDRVPLTQKTGGAAQTADELIGLASVFAPQPVSPVKRVLEMRDEMKESLKRQLGVEGTNRIRRLLGRPPIESSERLRVTMGESVDAGMRRLLFTDKPDVKMLLGHDVIEHLLAGSSSGYRVARELIADRQYDIVREGSRR